MSESCPFCMNSVRQGASVCTGCGARKAIKGGLPGAVFLIIVGIALLEGVPLLGFVVILLGLWGIKDSFSTVWKR